MEQTDISLIVGVRFSKVGKVYHFESRGLGDLKVGDMVVVETSRGWQLGQVAQIVKNPQKPPEGWKLIDRRATPRDLLLRQLWQQKESEVVANSRSKSEELRLSGIKIVEAEYSFDGSRLTIFFSSETEEKYDLKSMRGDMQKMFSPSQVEMRQIGPRDVAKTVCGMGACGLETRCCCSFLTEFSSISIRMAKEQGISLTPTEITGMCGRLRCCLIYEYDQYVDARKTLPKRNKWIKTPLGEGKVIDLAPLRDMVIVEIPEVGRREFLSSEVTPIVVETISPKESSKLAEEVQAVTEPSEIDQAISGEDVSPDPVEGVGDHDNRSKNTRPSRNDRNYPGRGPRGRNDANRNQPAQKQGPNPTQDPKAPDQSRPESLNTQQKRQKQDYPKKKKDRRHGGNNPVGENGA